MGSIAGFRIADHLVAEFLEWRLPYPDQYLFGHP